MKLVSNMLLLLMLSTPVLAVEVPPKLRSWLQALDSAPTPAQLQRDGGAQVVPTLEAVVRSRQESSYARHRAIGLLGTLAMAAEPTANQRLVALQSIDDPALRATAVVALAATCRRQCAVTVAQIRLWLADPAVAVRSAAARSLHWLPNHRDVRALAVKQLETEKIQAVQAELRQAIGRLDQPPPAPMHRLK